MYFTVCCLYVDFKFLVDGFYGVLGHFLLATHR